MKMQFPNLAIGSDSNKQIDIGQTTLLSSQQQADLKNQFILQQSTQNQFSVPQFCTTMKLRVVSIIQQSNFQVDQIFQINKDGLQSPQSPCTSKVPGVVHIGRFKPTNSYPEVHDNDIEFSCFDQMVSSKQCQIQWKQGKFVLICRSLNQLTFLRVPMNGILLQENMIFQIGSKYLYQVEKIQNIQSWSGYQQQQSQIIISPIGEYHQNYSKLAISQNCKFGSQVYQPNIQILDNQEIYPIHSEIIQTQSGWQIFDVESSQKKYNTYFALKNIDQVKNQQNSFDYELKQGDRIWIESTEFSIDQIA